MFGYSDNRKIKPCEYCARGKSDEPTHQKSLRVNNQSLGSTQVPFLMSTLEIPQKIAAHILALNLLLFLFLSFSLNYELILYFCFCSFSHLCGSFNHPNSTSLSFSEFSELFTFILLLSQHTESHFAHSSARCHF